MPSRDATSRYALANEIAKAAVEDSGEKVGPRTFQKMVDEVDAALATLSLMRSESYEAATLISEYFAIEEG